MCDAPSVTGARTSIPGLSERSAQSLIFFNLGNDTIATEDIAGNTLSLYIQKLRKPRKLSNLFARKFKEGPKAM